MSHQTAQIRAGRIETAERDNTAGVDSDSWCTPKWLADALGGFDVDVCTNERSHIRSSGHFDLEIGCDGLADPWRGLVWCNPPYSNVLPWAQRLVAHDGPWVALVKLDPSTKWWATLMSVDPQWAAFRKRIKFERPDKPPLTANFPSALVWNLWRPSAELAKHLWLQTYSRAA